MMNMYMTFTAYWNNIKAMLLVISVVMMILYCWIATIVTNKSIGPWKFAGVNCSVSSLMNGSYFPVSRIIFYTFFFGLFLVLFCFVKSFYSFTIFGCLSVSFLGIFIFLSFSMFCLRLFTTFSFAIFSLIILVFGCLMRQINAIFTNTRVFVIIVNRLNFLAFRALFWFNWFRHGLIPCIKSCLEPCGSYILPIGSFIISMKGGCVNS